MVKGIFVWNNMRNVNELINELCADEINELLEILTTNCTNIITDMTSNHKILAREKNNVCPQCGSIHIYKNGTRPNGVQKYICKDCKKTFSSTSHTVLSSSKKPYDSWIKFIKCELNHLTLEEIAEEVGISKTTVFNWRHKLFKALEHFISQIKLSKVIQLDSKYESINLKGTKPQNMPRYSKKRPGSAYKGISHHKVCIVSAVDENDNIIFKIAGLGKERIEFYNTLNVHIDNPTLMITDQYWVFTTVSKIHNCEIDQIPTTSHVSFLGNNINTLNQLHSELELWLSKYHGVSIRHLQGYLNMFVFIKYLKYKYDIKERKYKAFVFSLPTKAKLINRDICKLELPIDLKIAYSEYKYGICS